MKQKIFTDAQRDDLVIKLGGYVAKNYAEMTDARHSVVRSAISVIYNAVSMGTPLLYETAEAHGIEVGGWHDTLDKIIEATEARGSAAAESMKSVVAKTKEMDRLFKESDVQGVFSKIRFAKNNPV